MSNQVICENPRIIFNPLARDLIVKWRNVYLNGRIVHFRGSVKRLLDGSIDRYYKVPYKDGNCLLSHDDLDNYYVFDSSSGESVPLYIEVPCTTCSICVERKQYSFVERCKLETASYTSSPWFVTLTYDNEHVPFREVDGERFMTLNKRDVQLFLKRFRQFLARSHDGKYNSFIRYAVCGEYGKNTHRPHYHMIIWNIQSRDSLSYSHILDGLRSSWQNGFVSARLVDTKDDKAFRYTAKYCLKPYNKLFVDSQYSDCPFLSCSNRNGGIGKPFVNKNLVSYLRKTLDPSPQCMLFGKPCNVTVNSWLIDTAFPSFCRQVPSCVRSALRESMYYLSRRDCKYNNLLYFDYLNIFYDYMFLPYFEPDDVVDTFDFSCGDVEECVFVFFRWLEKIGVSSPLELKFHLETCVGLAYLRDKFIISCFSQRSAVDIDSRAINSRRDLSRQISNLKL